MLQFCLLLVWEKAFHILLTAEQSNFLVISIWCLHSSLEVWGLLELDKKYSMCSGCDRETEGRNHPHVLRGGHRQPVGAGRLAHSDSDQEVSFPLESPE